eukprot:3495699-Lingulodinium_polyedra.AAC.1
MQLRGCGLSGAWRRSPPVISTPTWRGTGCTASSLWRAGTTCSPTPATPAPPNGSSRVDRVLVNRAARAWVAGARLKFDL